MNVIYFEIGGCFLWASQKRLPNNRIVQSENDNFLSEERKK